MGLCAEFCVLRSEQSLHAALAHAGQVDDIIDIVKKQNAGQDLPPAVSSAQNVKVEAMAKPRVMELHKCSRLKDISNAVERNDEAKHRKYAASLR